MRQGNDAACGKEILSLTSFRDRVNSSAGWLNVQYMPRFLIVWLQQRIIENLTRDRSRHNYIYVSIRELQADVISQAVQPETRGTARTRHRESPCERCAGPGVCRQRVLRSARSDPGEVRNAATRPCRWACRGRCCRELRGIAPDVLQGADGFRARRPRRAIARQERTAWAPQVDCQGDELHHAHRCERAESGCRRVGRTNRTEAEPARSSANGRARARAVEKKPR